MTTSVGEPSRLAISRLVRVGLDPQPLLRKAGLPPTLMQAEGVRVPARSQIEFLNLAAQALDDQLLGFHIGLELDLRSLGLSYYVLASSETLGTALADEARQSGLQNDSLHLTYRRNSTIGVEFMYVDVERHLDVHQIEFWMTCHIRKCRLLSGRDVAPISVTFVHHHAGDVWEMNRYFDCQPQFGAKRDRVCWQAQTAQLPVMSYDPYLHKYLVAHETAFNVGRTPGQPELLTRVGNAITPRLSHATARIDNIAVDLGMSTRTLSRRLADEGETFSSVLEKVRSDLGVRYLQDQNLSISEISWRVGYTEVSAFVRAVRRWTGMAPGEIRKQLTAPHLPEETDHGRS